MCPHGTVCILLIHSHILMIFILLSSQDLTRLYRDARLVHADLSEYNLLWFRDQVYFIDVAQTVDIMHPFAMEFLLRDCFNVIQVSGLCYSLHTMRLI